MQHGMQERGQLDEIPIYNLPIILNGLINSPNEQQEDHGDPASAAELPSGARGHGGHAVGTLQELREATQRNGLRDDDLWR